LLLVLAILPWTWTAALRAADAPKVREFRIQKVGNRLYFHVRLDAPADLIPPRLESGTLNEVQRRQLGWLPRLVPQDGETRKVYQRLEIKHYRPVVGFDSEPQPVVPVQGLEFAGVVRGDNKLKFRLFYPSREPDPKKATPVPADWRPQLQTSWADVPIELDLHAATRLAPLDSDGVGRLGRDNLQKLWAEAQVAYFAVQEAQTPEFGFYGFACAATGRKYGVAAPSLGADKKASEEELHRRMYETTTGAAAITESMQLHRHLSANAFDRGPRTVEIWSVPGITIGEHPWEKMMAGKKPSPEPLAGFVPHDNYYVHFKDFRKFIEFGELLDQWGTSALQAYELTSRDYQLKARYEKQLCLKSTWLGKTLGPTLIKEMALTGSDPYLREGSDLTVIFKVASSQAFLTAVAPFLQEARQEFAAQLKEDRHDYHGTTVESFVSPLREVSVYRAVIGDCVLYSNSPTGIRRALDAHYGRQKALSDSLDFQYMRTIFRLEAPEEDGFVFLSDAFIRQLVGPTSKIKEKRRLEALTSLSMATNAALFAGWDNNDQLVKMEDLLAAAALKPEYLYTPEGKAIAWHPFSRIAASDAYNTIHFTTPLIELPIDRITATEEQEYGKFRQEYLNLWRQYFDPVGIRLALFPKQVRVETYILPLLNNGRYSELRSFTGRGTSTIKPQRLSPATLAQFLVSIGGGNDNMGIGGWGLLRLDDSPVLEQLADLWIRMQMDPDLSSRAGWQEGARLAFQLPVAAGVQVRDLPLFKEQLEQLRSLGQNFLGPYDVKELKPPYKGVVVTAVEFAPTSTLVQQLNQDLRPNESRVLPKLYHAFVDDGWYIATSEAPLKDLIDRWVTRRDSKEAELAGEQVTVNGSFYLAPKAAIKAASAVRFYLEWESHRRAITNTSIWEALYRAGILPEKATQKDKNALAMKFLGFVPVSPDGAGYALDPETGEVVNTRHGNLRRPKLHAGIDKGSPLDQLLDQFRTLRVDFRFREDGVNSVLTMERKGPAR
jgi:hypothetical protein